jgi:hypothetical protein
VDGTITGSCPVQGFVTNSVEPLGSTGTTSVMLLVQDVPFKTQP